MDVHHEKSAVLKGNTFFKNWGWLQLRGSNYLGFGLTILWNSTPDSCFTWLESVGLLAFYWKSREQQGTSQQLAACWELGSLWQRAGLELQSSSLIRVCTSCGLVSFTCSCSCVVSQNQDLIRKTKSGFSKTKWVSLVCDKVYHWPHYKNKILESHWNVWCGMLIKSIPIYKIMAVKGRSENTTYHMLLFSEGFKAHLIVYVCT